MINHKNNKITGFGKTFDSDPVGNVDVSDHELYEIKRS